jgi:hypothetical protein
MGCQSSKAVIGGVTIDDSIHVLLKHSPSHVFVARAPHPLLDKSLHTTTCEEEEALEINTSLTEDSVRSGEIRTEKLDLTKLLYHAKRHNDTVDQLDLQRFWNRPISIRC